MGWCSVKGQNIFVLNVFDCRWVVPLIELVEHSCPVNLSPLILFLRLNTLSKYHPDPNQLLSWRMLMAFSFPKYLVSMTNLSFLKIDADISEAAIYTRPVDSHLNLSSSHYSSTTRIIRSSILK